VTTIAFLNSEMTGYTLDSNPPERFPPTVFQQFSVPPALRLRLA
jgi:hypothetical protein